MQIQEVGAKPIHKFLKLGYMVLALLLASTGTVMAGPGFEPEQQEVPVDGGLSLLIAAGAAYGAKKHMKAARKNTER